jgi:hypothetical protein
MPTIYAAITNHGFGHATRTASVLAEIKRQNPEIAIIIATSAPRWLLEEYILDDFTLLDRTFDIGVIQADSLQVDKHSTLSKLKYIQQHQAELVEAEREFFAANPVDLIFGDMPPLATELAKLAGVPCWMAGNFGWDFIYRDWCNDCNGEFLAIADWMCGLYSQCDRLFRLPFHEEMSAFPHIQDVGLTGGAPRYSPEEMRAKFQLDRDRPTAMLSFGGLSLNQIPYDNLGKFPDWQFITFDLNAPDLPNLTRVDRNGLRPVDLMGVCDRLITKPGYGTISEACRVGVPLVCLTREGFLEAETLLAGVRDYTHHLIISPADFYGGDWQFLTAPLVPPALADFCQLDANGEAEIAAEVLNYFR